MIRDLLDLADIRPEEALFWTGAGISFAAPTCAPSGIELVERALDAAFLPDTLPRVQAAYRALEIPRTHPRLETVLDVIRRIHGSDALGDVLSDLRLVRSNGLHEFFAAHLQTGGRHITANFDRGIEQAGDGAGVLHFHGDISSGVDALGATLERIQRGFPEELEAALTVALAGARLVVVVGYSGSDAFDVVPFLRHLAADSLSGRTLIWLRHRPGAPEVTTSGDERVTVHFEALAHTGIRCVEISGDPAETVAALAAHWKLPFALDTSACLRAWRATVVIDQEQRRRASLELAATMGLHTDVERLLAPMSTRDADEWQIAAHTAWAQGRYRSARDIWRRNLLGNDTAGRARREERIGATLWVQGRLIHAYVYLARAITRTLANELSGEPLWLLVETQGRVLDHMRRRPLLRLFATPARRARLAALLPSDATDRYRSLGIHLDARLAAVKRALAITRGSAPDTYPDAVAAFSEAEALNAMLNYRHAALRRRAEARQATDEDYRRQHDGFVAIGATGDALRVMSLPGAASAFTLRDLSEDLRDVELAGWPKVLLLGRLAHGRWAQQVRIAMSPRAHRSRG